MTTKERSSSVVRLNVYKEFFSVHIIHLSAIAGVFVMNKTLTSGIILPAQSHGLIPHHAYLVVIRARDGGERSCRP